MKLDININSISYLFFISYFLQSWQCFSLFLSFMTFWSELISDFVQCPSIWVCLTISLDYIQSMHYWEGYRRSKVPFSVHPNKGYMMSECNTGDVNHDQLAQMLSARILYYKFIVFPFVIVKYFRRNTLRLCLNFYPLFLASIDFSSLWQLLLWISNGDFYICLISSTFINCVSFGRNSCPFPPF